MAIIISKTNRFIKLHLLNILRGNNVRRSIFPHILRHEARKIKQLLQDKYTVAISSAEYSWLVTREFRLNVALNKMVLDTV